MADLFKPTSRAKFRLLDPGAGIGSLTDAFLERCAASDMGCDSLEVVAYEMDERLHDELGQTLAAYSDRLRINYQVMGGDFIEHAVNQIQFHQGVKFTHAILNPPYKKISSSSPHRHLLRQLGIETVNLYSAFVALSIALIEKGGQLVAIVPRSFCNGPYYRPFREFMLQHSALKHIHLFEARNKAFKDDSVLQENIIILLERSGHQGPVTISTSTDDSFDDLATCTHPFSHIVLPNDPGNVVHIPTSADHNVVKLSEEICSTLEDTGISVSTGPVVDFRLKEYLRDYPQAETVPLLYPGHLHGYEVHWPKPDSKKPNAIVANEVTGKWLFPKGFYCVVRRFTSKEEKRRIVASVVRPDYFPDSRLLGFENHLNVFHEHKQGIPEPLAYGLMTYLNSTAVDQSFRRFSGHTQVNATDLKSMLYPNREALIKLGEWAMQQQESTQEMVDTQLESIMG